MLKYVSIWKLEDKWYVAVDRHIIICENAEWCLDVLDGLAERIVQ